MSTVNRSAQQADKFRRTNATPALLGGVWSIEGGQNVFTDGRGDRFWFVDTTAGAVTITFPAAADMAPDVINWVKRTTAGANSITVSSLSGTIDGAASHSIPTQYMCYGYVSDGTKYHILTDFGIPAGEGSVSISTMISTALGPYLTSASAATTLATYVTSNSLSAAVATDTLTVRGSAAVSATLSAGAVTVASKPIGDVILGYQAITAGNSFAFSGSWSDYAVLQLYAIFRTGSGTSATSSAAIYTDGGTTPILNLATASATLSTGQAVVVKLTVLGGNGIGLKSLDVETVKGGNLQTRAATATANTGFVNAIKFFTSATISTGMAVLYGFRFT